MNHFMVADKGIYSTIKLLEKADEVFPADVLSKMPQAARDDIRSAGRALAFELGTACGFHMIRATEAVIHKYYVEITGATPKRKDRNWGAYVRNLNAHNNKTPQSPADSKLIALIDQIREHHRNPVMHPEITLTPNEAYALFNVCQAAIVSLAAAIK